MNRRHVKWQQEVRRAPWPEEQRWDDAAGEPYVEDEVYDEPAPEPMREIIATNRTVLLTCTLAAMISPFALFLCFAEKRSRAIRHFAGQSAALLAVHLVFALVLLALGNLMGSIPLLGTLISMLCYLVYIAAAIVMVVLRIRMMFFAYQGIRFVLPFIGEMVSSRMDV